MFVHRKRLGIQVTINAKLTHALFGKYNSKTNTKYNLTMHPKTSVCLPFCSNFACVTVIGILSPGRKGAPSKILMAKSTEGS